MCPDDAGQWRAGTVSYLQFLDGMATAAAHPEFREKFATLSPNQLLTVLTDIPVMKKEEKMMMKALTGVERMCVNILAKKARKQNEAGGRDDDEDEAVKARLAEHKYHLLTDSQRAEVNGQHIRMCLWAGFFGFMSALVSGVAENVATIVFHTNGVTNPDTDEPSAQNEIVGFAIVVGCTIGICSILEIVFLYLYSLKYAMRVATASGLKLTPLNRDRTHVAQFLVQAALELGYITEPLHGVNPLSEPRSENACLMAVFMVLYKAKIALTGFLMKVALKRFASRDLVKFGAPYMAVPATMLWNALIGHFAMNEAELRCVGISTGIELFDSILNLAARDGDDSADSSLSPTFKLQLLRAIAAPIVRRRRIYPTQEVLLKHAVHVLRMSKEVDGTEGIVDSAFLFVQDMSSLSAPEQGQVLQVFVLTAILDGSFSKKEAAFYCELCNACDEKFQPHVSFIRYCAQVLRSIQPFEYDVLRQSVYWDAGDEAHVLTCSYHVKEFFHGCLGCCTC